MSTLPPDSTSADSAEAPRGNAPNSVAEERPPEERSPEKGRREAGRGHRRWSPRWFLRLGAQIALVVGVFLLASQWQTRNHLPRGAHLAPDFSLTDLEGNTVRLSDYRGKKVLLHFWATWCGVCRHEVGALNSLKESLGEDEVLLTVVANGRDLDAVSDFVRERDVRYPVLLGDEGILEAYRVSMFPTNYFLDPEGQVSASTVGMSSRWSLQARLGCSR